MTRKFCYSLSKELRQILINEDVVLFVWSDEMVDVAHEYAEADGSLLVILIINWLHKITSSSQSEN